MVQLNKEKKMIEVLFENRTEEDLPVEVYDNIEKGIIQTLIMEDYDNPTQVSVSIVTSEEIKSLNFEYRAKDSVTDVLSFPMNEEDENGTILLGDIVICYDKAKEQAVEYNHSITREITYLSVHSTLHLLGYDHLNKVDKEIMRSEEKEIMLQLNIFK